MENLVLCINIINLLEILLYFYILANIRINEVRLQNLHMYFLNIACNFGDNTG